MCVCVRACVCRCVCVCVLWNARFVLYLGTHARCPRGSYRCLGTAMSVGAIAGRTFVRGGKTGGSHVKHNVTMTCRVAGIASPPRLPAIYLYNRLTL